MWSAAVDPRVLVVRAEAASGERARCLDAASSGARTLVGSACEHLLLLRRGESVRLDVIAGTTTAGPVVLHFDIVDDDRLPVRLAAIQSFAAPPAIGRRHVQLAQRLLALHALDARQMGASLRETADVVLGPGDWPGDGEHRKSLVRRLVTAGGQMIRAGPGAILGL